MKNYFGKICLSQFSDWWKISGGFSCRIMGYIVFHQESFNNQSIIIFFYCGLMASKQKQKIHCPKKCFLPGPDCCTLQTIDKNVQHSYSNCQWYRCGICIQNCDWFNFFTSIWILNCDWSGLPCLNFTIYNCLMILECIELKTRWVSLTLTLFFCNLVISSLVSVKHSHKLVLSHFPLPPFLSLRNDESTVSSLLAHLIKQAAQRELWVPVALFVWL